MVHVFNLLIITLLGNKMICVGVCEGICEGVCVCLQVSCLVMPLGSLLNHLFGLLIYMYFVLSLPLAFVIHYFLNNYYFNMPVSQHTVYIL